MKTLMKSTDETASVTSAQAAIEGVLQTYETALNGSDIHTVELFVFQKGDDERWKIARYCFSTTNPLRQ